MLESYLAKYREASARDNINAAPPEARIISRATPALQPAYPKKLPIVLIAAFAAFALSAGFTVTGALLASPASVLFIRLCAGWCIARRQYATVTPAPATASTAADGIAALGARCRLMRGSGSATPLVVSTTDQLVRDLRKAGDTRPRRHSGRRCTQCRYDLRRDHAGPGAGADANVVLVDLAFSAPNLSVISTDPNAPGIAELDRAGLRRSAISSPAINIRACILLPPAMSGSDVAALSSSPMLATVIEALVHSYDHVVIDAGSVADVAVERLAPLASASGAGGCRSSQCGDAHPFVSSYYRPDLAT